MKFSIFAIPNLSDPFMLENNKTENDFCRMEIHNGIMHSYYKKDVVIDKKGAELIVEDRLKLIGERNLPVLVYDEGTREVKRDARVYLSSEAGMKGITAGAFIITNPVTKMVVQFWLALNANNSKFPIKTFSTADEALKWLESYKELT
jgi:hypothetical protein